MSMNITYYVYDANGAMVQVFYDGVIPPIGSEVTVATEIKMQRKTLIRGTVKSIHTEFTRYESSDTCNVMIVVEREVESAP